MSGLLQITILHLLAVQPVHDGDDVDDDGNYDYNGDDDDDDDMFRMWCQCDEKVIQIVIVIMSASLTVRIDTQDWYFEWCSKLIVMKTQ